MKKYFIELPQSAVSSTAPSLKNSKGHLFSETWNQGSFKNKMKWVGGQKRPILFHVQGKKCPLVGKQVGGQKKAKSCPRNY